MSAKIIATIATLTTKLEAAEAKATEITLKLEAAKAELATIAATQNAGVGSKVIILVGRGDTRREVEAIIRAARDKDGAEGVRTLKVEYTGAFTAGFEGVTRFTPDAFSNEFTVIDSTSIVRIEPVTVDVTTDAPVGDDASLEAQIAAANAQPVDLQFHANN